MLDRYPLTPLVVIALQVALAGCRGGDSAQAQLPTPAPPTPVRVAAVDRSAVRDRLLVPGLLAPRDTYELGFPSGGVLAAVDVDEGDEVRAGQVLARIDATAARASLVQAREGLARAERDLERARSLAGTGSLAAATLDDAATGAEVARAQLAAAGFATRYAVLRAPADGWIDARLADPGEVVGPGAPILRVASHARGWALRVAVPDRAVARLSLGSRAEVSLDALPARPLAARVIEIARMPSPATGSFDLELAVELPEDLTPRAGLVGRAVIPIGEPVSASVPMAALIDGRGREAAVFTIEGGRAHRRAVRVAFFTGERAAIAEGLDGVEAVITAGADRVEDGARVAVSEE